MEPIIWLGVLAVLLVIEGLTTALTTIWFAGGALAAAIAAGIGMGIVPQLLLFFCVSLVLLFFTRPAALKLMRKDTEKTNVEGLLGKKAVVIQKINNLAQTGQVRINDIEWMARTSDDSVTIPVDTVVIIKAVHGVKLIGNSSASQEARIRSPISFGIFNARSINSGLSSIMNWAASQYRWYASLVASSKQAVSSAVK